MARIIVADDEALFRTFIVKNLKKLGHDVVAVCTTGDEAVEKAEELRPEILLLDIHMESKFAGIAACKKIKTSIRDLRVVFISGYSQANITGYLDDVQFDGYLEKIFTIPMLEEALTPAEN